MNKLCPFCAEEIKEAAAKCKHCGEFLFEKKNKKIVNNKNPSKISKWFGWNAGIGSKLFVILITIWFIAKILREINDA